jgi:thiosulfate/3-mercaptopyruvate sulfurtransferase
MNAPFSTLIRVHELAAARRGEWVLFDCRAALRDRAYGASSYAAGHLPGAQFIDLDDELCRPPDGRNGRHPLPDAAAFAQTMGGRGVGPDTQVVCYDDAGGMFAARLWWMLRWVGHRQVALLDGGIQAWTAAGQPLATEVITPAPRALPFTLQAQMVVDAATVLQHLGDPAMCLIDARSPDRFRGENETLDPVGGHIPGALNRHFQHNLDAHGLFKPASVLQEEFGALIKGGDAHRVVHQCGSGVTACHNLLAMENAGLAGSRLYAGSWSEWCTDPARPIAVGAD